jgi:predicted ABC-type ATPase
LSSADLAIARVADRVGMGGHFVPEEVVRRRYLAGIRNFFSLYRPLTTTWALYNTSGPEPVRVADGLAAETMGVYDRAVWDSAQRQGTT